MDGQENLEGLGKSGSFKMAMAGSLQKIYLFCSRGEMYIHMR